MMQMTATVYEKAREASRLLTADAPTAQLAGMDGYFIAHTNHPLPEGATRLEEIGIDGTRYTLFAVVNGTGGDD